MVGQIISGLNEISVADWRSHCLRKDGIADQTVLRFWNVVNDMSQQQRSHLLQFVTGSATLPVGGFASLAGYGGPGHTHQFTLAPPRNASEHGRGLPTASTCF